MGRGSELKDPSDAIRNPLYGRDVLFSLQGNSPGEFSGVARFSLTHGSSYSAISVRTPFESTLLGATKLPSVIMITSEGMKQNNARLTHDKLSFSSVLEASLRVYATSKRRTAQRTNVLPCSSPAASSSTSRGGREVCRNVP